MTHDGTHLAVGGMDGKGRVRILNLATGREEKVRVSPAFDRLPREKSEGIQSLAFSPDGKWLVVASTLDVARWQWQRNEPMEQIGTMGQMQSVAFAADSNIVAVGRATLLNDYPSIRLFDAETARGIQEIVPLKGREISHGAISVQLRWLPLGSPNVLSGAIRLERANR